MSRLPKDPKLVDYTDRLAAINEQYVERVMEAECFADILDAANYLRNATFSLWREAHDKK